MTRGRPTAAGAGARAAGVRTRVAGRRVRAAGARALAAAACLLPAAAAGDPAPWTASAGASAGAAVDNLGDAALDLRGDLVLERRPDYGWSWGLALTAGGTPVRDRAVRLGHADLSLHGVAVGEWAWFRVGIGPAWLHRTEVSPRRRLPEDDDGGEEWSVASRGQLAGSAPGAVVPLALGVDLRVGPAPVRAQIEWRSGAFGPLRPGSDALVFVQWLWLGAAVPLL